VRSIMLIVIHPDDDAKESGHYGHPSVSLDGANE
jgi:hypothetical protein